MQVTMMTLRRLQATAFCVFIWINVFAGFAHPLSFNITQFDAGANNILYDGDATPTNGVIELNAINDEYHVGWARYAEPVHLWDSISGSSADLTTHFTFIVDTRTLEIFSDGFTFFFAPVGYPIPPNSAGGYLGLFNARTYQGVPQNKIVAVEFDTFSNKEWDPQGSHVGININEISSIVHSTSWNVSSNSGKVANVWITYNATTNNLSVFWTYDQNPVFVNNSSLSYHIDLQKSLPEQVTIGFSASTGVYPERHIIKSWEFNSNLEYSDEIGSKNKEKGKKTFLIGAVAVCVFILMLGVAICRWVGVRNRISSHSNTAVPSINTHLESLALPKRFSYQELVAATNGFANNRRLGQGGSGQVYRGIIQDLGYMVAVKRIFADSDSELHYEKIFINEVKIISRLMHQNLVQFIGWCHEQGECLLVYAYMPNGSLDNHLFGCRTALQWDFRYKIAFGLASALHYLHEDAEQCVLHRDIKSANVLLDSDFRTKLGDFGIAKVVDPRSRTHHTTGVAGTFGYIAPEYAFQGRASKESDMFSFGVVALELACGRRTYQDGEYHVPLFGWVWQLHLEGNLLSVADERLEMNFDRKEMECLLIVGLWCTNPNNKDRPKAGQVMKVLQLESPLPELPHDMHDQTQPQPAKQHVDSSHASLTSSFTTLGR